MRGKKAKAIRRLAKMSTQGNFKWYNGTEDAPDAYQRIKPVVLEGLHLRRHLLGGPGFQPQQVLKYGGKLVYRRLKKALTYSQTTTFTQRS